MSPNALRTIFDPLKGKSPKTFENAYDLQKTVESISLSDS